MLENVKRTYALADYTAECKGGKWFFWKTARYGDKEERRGPYSSIESVTLMIARQLKREINKREERHKLPE
jgi:ribosome-associated translation inhibitor RaiA